MRVEFFPSQHPIPKQFVMKKNIAISIPTPCTENWGDFTSTNAGGYCASCCKEVIDFSRMTDEEIVSFFTRTSGHICGRFRSDQLKEYMPSPQYVNIQVRPGLTLLYASIMSLLLTLSANPLSARAESHTTVSEITYSEPSDQVSTSPQVATAHTITGVVKDAEMGSPLPAVSIYLKGADSGTISDEKGAFEFPVSLNEGDVLVFSFIGYESVEYVVTKEPNQSIEIKMEYSTIMMMGKVAVDEPYEESATGLRGFWQKLKRMF